MKFSNPLCIALSAASILAFSACSKSSLTPPGEETAQTTLSGNKQVTAAATTPVGTVIYTSNGYKLTFTNNASGFDDATRQKFVDMYFSIYPKLLNRFYTGATKQVTFVIDPNYNGVAYTSGTTVTYSAAWMANHPQDVDVLTHEVMHVVQAYTGGTPGWLTEGIADYVRYKYGVNNGPAGWSLPAWSSSQSYTDAYRVTARFLVWLELHVRATIVDDLNTALRNKTYSGNTWNQLTGKSVDQLWTDYSNNPAL
ncbi:secretory protein [Chitinophaga oryzae]|uniref:Secretory protein n=1 Tax=Chitinophaga oryzae TaxID=2725414 RepID=A0AAE6ZFD6_9BACT|nr:basic secretory protein-like protein [Chitinophaga oryzae]QJB31960.1 secretory protein [Chitinophaga oryzae]QJB38438.1 secretory protein [Chitinophaga oryzae]